MTIVQLYLHINIYLFKVIVCGNLQNKRHSDMAFVCWVRLAGQMRIYMCSTFSECLIVQGNISWFLYNVPLFPGSYGSFLCSYRAFFCSLDVFFHILGRISWML